MEQYVDYDDEEPIEKRFEDLCNDLCVEASIREDAWERYKENWTNYSIDGDQLQWLVCAVYECCRRPGPDGIVDSSYVSLTRLLRSAKMNLVQFFHRMKKWVQMTQVSEELRERVDRLEHVFCVSTVTFKRFTPIFCSLFKNPFGGDGDSPGGTQVKSNPQSPTKRPPSKFKRNCSSNDVFNFAWILFVQVKSHFPAVGDDLVNSYHLLLCCMDWLFGNALCSGRRDLINSDFRGVPRNLHNKDWRPPEVPPCFLRHICDDHDGVFVEAKVVKEHWFRKYIEHLFDRHVLKGREETLCGVLDGTNFEVSYRCINTAYEEFVLTVGDLDERVFLGENAEDEIGTPSLLKGIQLGAAEVAPSARRYMQEVMTSGSTGTRRRSSSEHRGMMLTKRRHPYPAFAESQSIGQVQALLCGRAPRPSESLSQLLEEHCVTNVAEEVEEKISAISNQLRTAILAAIQSRRLRPDGSEPEDVAQARVRSILCLFYMSLESIVFDEVSRLRKRAVENGQPINLGPSLTNLLANENILRCLLATSSEVVLFCLTPDLTFPWILSALDTEPFHFLKVIEILVRNVDFPRDIVKHMKWVVETIVDSVAWRGESPLWTMLNAGRAPSIEDVTHPNNFELERPPNSVPAQPGKKLIVESASGMSSPHRILGIPSEVTRRRLYPTAAAADESAMAASAILETSGNTKTVGITDMSGGIISEEKRVRTDSLGLFFRQVYHLSSIRLRDLCDRLNITRDLMTKVWTCFEFVVVDHTDLLRDRCLDQILLCCLYALARAAVPTHRPVLPFVDILKQYRLQPQATPDVYRSVLLSIVMASPGKESGSGGSRVQTRSTGAAGRSGAGGLRSISPPPVPKEERGDIVDFYNAVFLPRVKQYLRRFVPPMPSTAGPGGVRQRIHGVIDPSATPAIQLSPLPMRAFNTNSSQSGANQGSPGMGSGDGRRLTATRNLFLSPVKTALTMSPKRIQFTIQRSPSKELREINQMINLAERKVIMASMAPQTSGSGVGASTGIKRLADRHLSMECGSLGGLAKRLNFGHSDTIF